MQYTKSEGKDLSGMIIVGLRWYRKLSLCVLLYIFDSAIIRFFNHSFKLWFGIKLIGI
jgi:hypothetical protein